VLEQARQPGLFEDAAKTEVRRVQFVRPVVAVRAGARQDAAAVDVHEAGQRGRRRRQQVVVQAVDEEVRDLAAQCHVGRYAAPVHRGRQPWARAVVARGGVGSIPVWHGSSLEGQVTRDGPAGDALSGALLLDLRQHCCIHDNHHVKSEKNGRRNGHPDTCSGFYFGNVATNIPRVEPCQACIMAAPALRTGDARSP
jgi:hypothetical protein